MTESVDKPNDFSNHGSPRPELKTERLRLRPFQIGDAPAMEVLINDREIAANTRTIDYPYPRGSGTQWIEKHPDLWKSGKSAIFAICELATGDLMGAIGLEVDSDNHAAELGYWLGREFWGRGFTTEAAKQVVSFGFENLGLYKIHAHHLSRNPASGRVLEKIGMHKEGVLRGHVRKWGVFEDVVVFGALAKEWS